MYLEFSSVKARSKVIPQIQIFGLVFLFSSLFMGIHMFHFTSIIWVWPKEWGICQLPLIFVFRSAICTFIHVFSFTVALLRLSTKLAKAGVWPWAPYFALGNNCHLLINYQYRLKISLLMSSARGFLDLQQEHIHLRPKCVCGQGEYTWFWVF